MVNATREHIALGRSSFPRSGRAAAFLFLVAVFVYNLNLRGISSGDNVPGGLLPFAILVDGTITLDRYEQWYRAREGGTPYFLTISHDHAYSTYPIGLPLLVTPAYAPVVAALGVRSWPTEAIVSLGLRLEKLAGSVIAALAVVTFFALAFRLIGAVRPAVLLSIAFGFATPTWSISSQALWQHTGTEFTMLLGLLALHWYRQTGRNIAATLAGGCAALAAAIRPTATLFVVALYVYWLVARPRRWRTIAWFSVPVAAIGAVVASYNLWVFRDLRGGYTQPFNGSLVAGLAGVLFSPSRGLLVFCPFLCFAVVGVKRWARGGYGNSEVYLPALLYALLHVLVVARWFMWWGGELNYGPRLLTDVTPAACLLLVPAWPVIRRSALVTGVFAVFVLHAGTLQAVGAFCFPRGSWGNTPVSVSQDPSRLWDWGDSQTSRSLRAGPELRPYRDLVEEWRRW